MLKLILFMIFLHLLDCLDVEGDELREDILSALESESSNYPLHGYDEERSLRGLFDCRDEGSRCGGFVSCCKGLYCYWKNGYSLIRTGVCVTCVDKNQTCQHHAHCCGGLVCQKGKALYIDGICSDKSSQGQPCYEKAQCSSNNCIRNAWQRMVFQNGYCE